MVFAKVEVYSLKLKRPLEVQSCQAGHTQEMVFQGTIEGLPECTRIVFIKTSLQIKVHDVARQETTQTFANHVGRVKRLEVAQDCPNLLWSASEDGTVM